MRYLVLVLIGILIAAPALATPPAIGVYSPDNGRFSESWKNGQEGAKDNTINAASYPATQWYLTCMVASAKAVEIDRDMDVNGTGWVKYETQYGGGVMWLSAGGPWGDGSEDYTCTVSPVGMTVTVTHSFVLGTWLGAVSDITVGGVFDNYDNCFTYTLSNAAIEGFGATVATDYPDYQDENCATGTSVFGAWGSVDDITLAIYSPTDVECTIPVNETSWGQIKSMYKD